MSIFDISIDEFNAMMNSLRVSVEDVNAMLNSLADADAIEPMAEPIDESDCDPFDYAEVTGLFDEMYPETDWYY